MYIYIYTYKYISTFNISRYEIEGRFLSSYPLSLSLSTYSFRKWTLRHKNRNNRVFPLSRIYLKYIFTFSESIRIYLPLRVCISRVFHLFSIFPILTSQSLLFPSPLFFSPKLFSIFPNTLEKGEGIFTDSRHGKLLFFRYRYRRAESP